MLPKILRSQYDVPPDLAEECAELILTNDRHVDLIRDIGGSPHVLLDAELAQLAVGAEESGIADDPAPKPAAAPETPIEIPTPAAPQAQSASSATTPKPIFVGHGKNKTPLQQLQRLLTTFQIPHKIVVDEANLGRPISQKVKETIEDCGSAILIFTRDEQFFDAAGNEVWRPSKNVVHELGATSFAYGDRIVIFKEKGLHFPTNFQSIGYIEFEANDIQARTADLLKELIGFGLVRVTPTY
jgi:predicted nucleotide-binding protein